MKVGLTGSFGSGKSTVARMFEECGASVVDADRIARDVVAPGGEALGEIAATFGPDAIGPDGALDRRRLGERVFADAAARRRLEAIVHPRVREREWREAREHETRGAPVIVFDVPLLYETGFDRDMDRVVVVTVDEPTRYRRLGDERGLSREEIDRRLAAQTPQAEKAARADHVIDNSADRGTTRTQVRRLYDQLTGEHLGNP